jgi:hypothetical protein
MNSLIIHARGDDLQAELKFHFKCPKCGVFYGIYALSSNLNFVDAEVAFIQIQVGIHQALHANEGMKWIMKKK